MTDAVSVVKEQATTGPLPAFELQDWAERYGVVAGITVRGEESGRGFDLGLWSEAPTGEVMRRWREFRQAIPGFNAVILGNQVHQTRVLWHDRAGEGWVQIDGVDGHATASPGTLLTVTVADCVPVYLVAPERRVVALLHAGWRGTAAGILPVALEVLKAHAGVSASELVMHCGIAICGSCYEVGPEVLEAMGLRGDDRGPWHLDIRERLVEQAVRAGIQEVSTSGWCTSHHHPLFYSHRASHGTDGRMVAYLGIPAGIDGPALPL